jgi:adenosylcobinamide-GDP ribazoletransferase
VLDGLRLAVTTFTIVPVKGGRVDRGTAGAAMRWAPLVGAALGVVLGGVAVTLHALLAPALVAGVIVVGLGLILTRGLHIDGLADTVDGFGSYADSDRALAIMKQPDVGPFGVAAIVLALLAQVAAVAELLSRPPVVILACLAVAAASGRLAATWACRQGVPGARREGLGALVAGTISIRSAAVLTLLVLGGATWATTDQLWQGPLAVAVALSLATLLTWHAVRRFGGITGDVLGACVELTTTVTLIGLVW